MKKYSNTVVDQDEIPVLGAEVYVYDNTGGLATLTTDGTTPITQPILTDANGYYEFFADEGLYNAKIFWTARERLRIGQLLVGDDIVDRAEAAAEEAEDQVALAAIQVGLAEDQVSLAAAQVVLASNEADRSEAAADRSDANIDIAVEAAEAVLAGDRVFATFALGVAGTTAGQVFYVVVDGYPQFYKNGTSTDADDIYYYTGPQYAADTPILLKATTRAFAEGDILNTADGHSYLVAASAATDQDVTTAGGVKLYIQPSADGSYNFAAKAVSTTEVTTELQEFFDDFAGNRLILPYRSGGYTASVTYPKADTHIILLPGFYMEGLGTGTSCGFLFAYDNVTITAYGAKINHLNADTSSTLYLSRPKRTIIEGIELDGPGLPDISESDCIYVGGTPDANEVTEDFVLRDIKAYGARRNILSVTAAHRGLVEGCDFSATVDGTFKKGIDLEANRWMANGDYSVKYITIRKTYVHDTLGDGILCSWSHGTLIDDCVIENAGEQGINITPSTQGGSESRNARTGDQLGISAIDSATGWITVSTTVGEKLIDDLGILPGYWIILGTNGGTYPTELTGYNCIEEISSDQQKIRVSQNPGYGKIVATTGSGTGTLSNDPYASALYALVFRDGNASKVTIRNTTIINPTEHAIRMSVASRVLIDNVEMRGVPSGYSAVNAQYSRDITVINSRGFGGNVSKTGVVFTKVSTGITRDNVWHDFTNEGLAINGVSDCTMSNDLVRGCGASSGGNGAVFVQKTTGATLSPRVHNGPNGATRGIRLASTSSFCLVVDADCRGAGTSNTSSIADAGTNNRVVNSRRYDGTWYT